MSNLHSKQTGKQVHFPKNYERGDNMSVPFKIDGNVIGYLMPRHKYVTVIDAVADSNNSLQDKYFCIYSENNAEKIAMYFNVSGGGNFTAPSDVDRSYPITITTNDNASAVADAVVVALTALNNIMTQSNGNLIYETITVTSARIQLVQYSVSIPVDIKDTGFTVTNALSSTTQDAFLKWDSSRDMFTMESIKEYIADTVGEMVTGNTETNITVTYNDQDNTLDFVASAGSSLTTEEVQDIVGAMFSGNTESGIVATYQDSDGTIDLTVQDTTKKDKDTINALIGRGDTDTDLGTFTGEIIQDSRDVKTAFQDIETKLDLTKLQHLTVSGYANKSAQGFYAKNFPADYHNWAVDVVPDDADNSDDSDKSKWYHMYSEMVMPRAVKIHSYKVYYGGVNGIGWELYLYKASAPNDMANVDINLTQIGNTITLSPQGNTTVRVANWSKGSNTDTLSAGDVLICLIKKTGTDSANKAIWWNGTVEYETT